MFKGLGNLGNIASMVGALQQLPEKMQELNEQMKSERVSASSQCGNVHISMNGNSETPTNPKTIKFRLGFRYKSGKSFECSVFFA